MSGVLTMKIACERCGARYSVADDKVRGRTFKIRCRRCSEVIIFHPAAAPRWYLALDGVEAGPLTTSELSRTIIEGDVEPATPAWREGLGDWTSLSQLAEFAHLLALAEPTPEPETAGTRDLFGPPPEAPELATQPDIMSPEAPLLVGSRNESSVLFSIGNLQALAGGGAAAPAATPASDEGSGLIDIRSMAQGLDDSTEAPVDLPALGQPAAAVLMPSSSSPSTPRWLFPVLAGMGAALAAAVVALVLALTPAAEAEAPPPPATTAPQPESNEYIDTDEVMVKVQEPVKVPARVPAAVKEPPTNKIKAEPRLPKRPTTRPRTVAVRPRAARPRAARPETAEPKRPQPGKVKKRCAPSDLDCLIDGISMDHTAPPVKVVVRQPTVVQPAVVLPATLSSSEVQRGMRLIRAGVKGCFDRFRVPGWAQVRLTISSNGRVRSARLKGIFAGTPTGACLKSVVSRARFPRFATPSLSIEYPFHLRES